MEKKHISISITDNIDTTISVCKIDKEYPEAAKDIDPFYAFCHYTIPLSSILIPDLLSKADQIFDFELRSVVEDSSTVHFAENLMLVGDDDLYIRQGGAVNDGIKVHLKPAVAGGKGPGFGEIIRRDVEDHVIQLMPLSVVEEDILRGGGGVAKPISNIEAEGLVVYHAVAGTPIPGIVIGPYAAAPIQSTKVGFRIEDISLAVIADTAGSGHAVDFLVVIEGLVLVERRCDDHGIHLRLAHQDIAVKILLTIEFFEAALDATTALFKGKSDGNALIFK